LQSTNYKIKITQRDQKHLIDGGKPGVPLCRPYAKKALAVFHAFLKAGSFSDISAMAIPIRRVEESNKIMYLITNF
jgi:hypothetical protein